MSIQARIEAKLKRAFKPERIAVINESHLHAGHGGASGEKFDGSGETHFRVRIISAVFSGMSRLERHRCINNELDEELAESVHALAIEPAAPGEAVRW